MARTVLAPMNDALSSNTITLCHLLTVYMDSETVRLTDGVKDVTSGLGTWMASGEFLEFDGLEELLGNDVVSVTVALSGIDQSWIAVLQQQNYIDRRLTVHLAIIDDDGRLVKDPIMQFDGRIDQPIITDNPEAGTCVISLAATNQWVDFERAPGRHTNPQDQALWFYGDRGFDYIAQLVDKQVWWGRSAPAGAAGATAPVFRNLASSIASSIINKFNGL